MHKADRASNYVFPNLSIIINLSRSELGIVTFIIICVIFKFYITFFMRLRVVIYRFQHR